MSEWTFSFCLNNSLLFLEGRTSAILSILFFLLTFSDNKLVYQFVSMLPFPEAKVNLSQIVDMLEIMFHPSLRFISRLPFVIRLLHQSISARCKCGSFVFELMSCPH